MAVPVGPMVTLTLPAGGTQEVQVGTVVRMAYRGGAAWVAQVCKELKPLPDGRRRLKVVLLPERPPDG
jgi:hypothetical protein